MVVISNARWAADSLSGGVRSMCFMVGNRHRKDPPIMIQIAQEGAQRRVRRGNGIKLHAPIYQYRDALHIHTNDVNLQQLLFSEITYW
jgi:hypothetical protein